MEDFDLLKTQMRSSQMGGLESCVQALMFRSEQKQQTNACSCESLQQKRE